MKSGVLKPSDNGPEIAAPVDQRPCHLHNKQSADVIATFKRARGRGWPLMPAVHRHDN